MPFSHYKDILHTGHTHFAQWSLDRYRDDYWGPTFNWLALDSDVWEP